MRIYLDSNFKTIKTTDASQITQFNIVPVEVWTTIPFTEIDEDKTYTNSIGMNFVRPDGYKLQQIPFEPAYDGEPQIENDVTYYVRTGKISIYNTAIIPGTNDFGYALLSFTIAKVLNLQVVQRLTSPIIRLSVIRSIEPNLPYDEENAVELLATRVDILELPQPAFTLDTVAPAETLAIGETRWNNTYKTTETRLSANVVMQHGQEVHFPSPCKAVEAIAEKDVVMWAGAQGGFTLIAKARASYIYGGVDIGLAKFPRALIGVATEPIANNADGKITWFGDINELNTNSYAEGTILYADLTVAGGMTSTRPVAPNPAIIVGMVKRQNPAQGVITIRPDMGYYVSELHDMYVANPVDGDTFRYNGTTQRYERYNIAAEINAIKARLDALEA